MKVPSSRQDFERIHQGLSDHFARRYGREVDTQLCPDCDGPPAMDAVVHRYECPRHPRLTRDSGHAETPEDPRENGSDGAADR